MTEQEIKNLVGESLSELDEFNNFHGITKENINSFVVPPYQVIVDPDDLETEKRNMWVVLNPPGNYLIAYDIFHKGWSVIESGSSNEYVQVVVGSSLAEALDGM